MGRSGGGRRCCAVVLAVHHVRHNGMLLRGGAEKYVRSCVRGLLAAGADVIVNYSGDSVYEGIAPPRAGQRFELHRTEWIDERLGSDRRLRWAVVRERMRWFRAVRPDAVLVVQQGQGGAFGASVAAARLVGARVVMSVRQPPASQPGASGKRYWGVIPSLELWRRRLRWRAAAVARCCHAIVFNSTRVMRTYVSELGFPARRCMVIPNGVERCEGRPGRRGGGRVVFGCVGQVSAHKGADVVLEACRKLARRAAFEVVFFGDGPLLGAVRAAAGALPVRAAGYEPDAERIYSGLDVLVAASRRESSSNAVLEAMARGLACVVSDAGGLPELVEDGVSGLVVAAGDAAALATAMGRLAADEGLRARLGMAVQARARDCHDEAVRMQETAALVLGTAGRLSASVSTIRRTGGRLGS